MRKLILLVAVLVVTMLVVACGSSKPAVVMDEPVPAGADGAQIVNLSFNTTDISPATVTVKAGQKVLFVVKNTDPKEDHNVVSQDLGIKEILVVPGQTARRLWTPTAKPGEYPTGCTIHPDIRMKIVVQ
ncbi:MAG: cupredoxin domain-containing protein [Chloroflexi bacterium]|nr:cupredoxin domain-containing protein [Chloroflexota bacterium]